MQNPIIKKETKIKAGNPKTIPTVIALFPLVFSLHCLFFSSYIIIKILFLIMKIIYLYLNLKEIGSALHVRILTLHLLKHAGIATNN